MTGTPGVSATYGVNVSEGIENALSEFARGIYEMMGSPLDPPSGDGTDGGYYLPSVQQ